MVTARLEPNVVTFNAVLKSCSRRGDLASAAHWLDEMCRAALQPDKITLTSLLTTCIMSPTPGKARAVFQRLVAEHGVRPDRIALSTLSDAVGDSQAETLSQELQVRWLGENRSSSVAAASSRRKPGDWDCP